MEKMEPSSKPTSQATPAKKGRGMMYAAIAVVLIIIVILAVYFFYMMPTPANVNIVDDGACGLNSASCKFNPTPYSTTSGKEVVWKNTGSVAHTVDWFTNNSTSTPPSNSGNMSPGATYKATFSTAGTYQYYCLIHQWMHGTVTVT